ncbi:UPF0182 family protein [Candidatus Woesearchaeota archaeon]|nr:UPF0182 family protein [Candidatus Woesearchaeota archaeon]
MVEKPVPGAKTPPKVSRAHLWVLGVVIVLIIIAKIASLYTDYLWFLALGFQDIFTITLSSKLALFAIGTVAFFIIGVVNLLIARHFHKSDISFRLKLGILAILSLVVGLYSSRAWLTVQ